MLCFLLAWQIRSPLLRHLYRAVAHLLSRLVSLIIVVPHNDDWFRSYSLAVAKCLTVVPVPWRLKSLVQSQNDSPTMLAATVAVQRLALARYFLIDVDNHDTALQHAIDYHAGHFYYPPPVVIQAELADNGPVMLVSLLLIAPHRCFGLPTLALAALRWLYTLKCSHEPY